MRGHCSSSGNVVPYARVCTRARHITSADRPCAQGPRFVRPTAG